MKSKQKSKKYLKNFLRVAPLSHALWRSVEALSFEKVEFNRPVLDLGCGFGEFAGVVFNKIETGIDIDESDLRKAIDGKKYKKLQWADARKLPFKNNSYSTVVSVSVMEHISGADKVIKEVARVLKKNGIFAFSVPTPSLKDNLLAIKFLNLIGQKKLSEKYWDLHCKAFKHVNLKPSIWWEKNLKKNGFEIVQMEGTLSPTLLHLHEIFLISAFPSQFGKLFFGKRLIMSVGLRSNILPIFFSRFIYVDKNSDINIFFVAKKK